MKRIFQQACLVGIALVFPALLHAQTPAIGVKKMHDVLAKALKDMIPECEKLINISTAIAGFGTLFYIGYRVWKHIAAAEPVDFFPLLRPFAMSLLIGMFPIVLAVMEGILSPITLTTTTMVENGNKNIQVLIDRNAKAILNGTDHSMITDPTGNNDWRKYYDEDLEGEDRDSGIFSFGFSMITNTLVTMLRLFMSKVLELLYYAASLCIDVMRTFHLLILSLLGPLVFAFSCYDGLQHTLTVWIGRYINVYLWLPICNLFGALLNKIQENLLNIDYSQMAQTGSTMFTQTDLAYMIFMVIAVYGYFCVPSIANYVVHASGDNGLMRKVSGTFRSIGGGGGSGSSASINNSGGYNSGSMAADRSGSDTHHYSLADAKNSEPYINDNSSYQEKQLKG